MPWSIQCGICKREYKYSKCVRRQVRRNVSLISEHFCTLFSMFDSYETMLSVFPKPLYKSVITRVKSRLDFARMGWCHHARAVSSIDNGNEGYVRVFLVHIARSYGAPLINRVWTAGITIQMWVGSGCKLQVHSLRVDKWALPAMLKERWISYCILLCACYETVMALLETYIQTKRFSFVL